MSDFACWNFAVKNNLKKSEIYDKIDLKSSLVRDHPNITLANGGCGQMLMFLDIGTEKKSDILQIFQPTKLMHSVY